MEMKECQFCTGEVPANARKCKHCGEWLTAPAAMEAVSAASQGSNDTRVVCRHCGKQMVPRIILVAPAQGWTPVPKSSVCPFCGGTHMKFPMSSAERIVIMVIVGLFVLVSIVFLAR